MESAEPHEKTLVGRYVIHAPIASGGMATVHVGRVNGAGGFARVVAIKRLHPQFARDPDFSAMLLDEARLTGVIRHPNVVPTLDVVQAEGELFMVMEYVSGESLARLLREARERGVHTPARVGAAIVAGTLAGLHAAHEARTDDGVDLAIVHRDVSPQNILVGRDGIPRLVDFGIARAAVRAQVTREGQLKGKLRYMAPEQLRRRREIDRRADVYATGVVLWEVLTGERLFDGQSDAEVFGNVLEGVVPPPSTVADLPVEIDRVVLRALARDPDERFATAREMAEALASALPPAGASEVGAWVEGLVGDLLADRAACVAAFESPTAIRTLPPSAPIVTRRERAASPPPPASSEPRLRRATIPASPALTRTLTSPALSKAPQLKLDGRSRDGEGASDAPTTDASTTDASTSDASTSGERAVAVAPISLRPSPPRRIWMAAVLALSVIVVGATAFAIRAPEKGAIQGAAPPSTPSASPTLEAPEPARTEPARAEPTAEPARTEPTAEPTATTTASASPPPRPRPEAQRVAPSPAHPPRARSRCVPPYYVDADGIRRVKRECL